MLDVTAAAKPTSPKTVTTKHLAYMLAETHQLSKKQASTLMQDLIGMITKHLKKGERVKIAGLGILQVRSRAARMTSLLPAPSSTGTGARFGSRSFLRPQVGQCGRAAT